MDLAIIRLLHTNRVRINTVKIALQTLGCRLNEAELQKWSRDFQARGHDITRATEDADLIVLNTCAVTSEAVKKSRQLIRKSHRNNPRAKLVVSGCYSSLEPDAAQSIEGIDLVVDNSDKERLVEIASQELELPSMPSMATAAGENAIFTANKSRAFIKIQDGCRYRCTFCIVTVARGNERSRTEAELIEEVQTAYEQGINEVILTGVHAGGYGSDIESSLSQLISQVLKHTDVPRIRMGSVEPWDLGDDFMRLFENDRFMPHLHLPLQSGSDTVLRRMARRCKTSDYLELVHTLRETVPDFQVSTDIIVGFPGETEAEFAETKHFVEQMDFSHIHIFSYSPRQGTKAARLPSPVDKETKRQRSRELHDIAFTSKAKIYQSMMGKQFPVLWESAHSSERDGHFKYQGYTPNFLRVCCEAPESKPLQQTVTAVRIAGVSEDGEQLLAG